MRLVVPMGVLSMSALPNLATQSTLEVATVARGDQSSIEILLPWGSLATWPPHDAQLWPRMLLGFPFQSLRRLRCAAHGHISKGKTTSGMHTLLARREAKVWCRVKRHEKRQDGAAPLLLEELNYCAAICSMAAPSEI